MARQEHSADGDTGNLVKNEDDYVPLNSSGFGDSEEDIQFEERQYDHPDPLEYENDKADPGYVLILNYEERRPGTAADVKEIYQCFGKQGYNITRENILNNANEAEIEAKVAEVIDKKLKDTNSLIVFVLSHGGANDHFQIVNNPSYSVQKFMQLFLVVPELANKPKIFIFQTCKKTNHLKKDDIQLYADVSLIKHPNVLVAYSTLEGDESYRHPETGTVFIQQLCRNIYQYGSREDILSILTRCNKCITKGPPIKYTKEDGEKQTVVDVKQTPLFISTLKRHFYICRSKERRFQLDGLHRINSMIARVKARREEKKSDAEETGNVQAREDIK